MFNLENTSLYHDAFLQKGGAEEVAVQWSNTLKIPLTTLAIDQKVKPELSLEPKVLFEFISSKSQLERAFPLLPLLLQLVHSPKDEDIRLVSTTGVAHLIPGFWRKRIVYMHAPTRWIWEKDIYEADRPEYFKIIMNMLRPYFKNYDSSRINDDDILIANSRAGAGKILSSYGRKVPYVYPPLRKMEIEAIKPFFPETFEGFFLTVGRFKGYKNFAHVLHAIESSGARLILVGEGTEIVRSEFAYGVGRISNHELKWLYRNATALIAVALEDFGLTAIEAASNGCPTIAYKHYGYLDSVSDGVSGEFVTPNDVSDLSNKIKAFNPRNYEKQELLRFAQKFSIEKHLQEIERIYNDN